MSSREWGNSHEPCRAQSLGLGAPLSSVPVIQRGSAAGVWVWDILASAERALSRGIDTVRLGDS